MIPLSSVLLTDYLDTTIKNLKIRLASQERNGSTDQRDTSGAIKELQALKTAVNRGEFDLTL